MKTLILTKRVMSPRNILNNLVEGDINSVMKAMDFFKKACRPTVGYKQIADYLGVTVLVDTGMRVEVEKMSKKDMYRAEAIALRQAMTDRKNNNKQSLTLTPKPSEPEVGTNMQLDFDAVEQPPMNEIHSDYYAPEVGMDHRDWYEEDRQTQELVKQTIKEYYEEPDHSDELESLLTYEEFAEELYKGFHLKTTRRLDEIERVIKAVYRKHKNNLKHKEACRNLCIQAREAYQAMMDENPSNWTWIPTHTYTKRWFAHAVRVCTPNEE